MTFKTDDRVYETSVTTGTGDYTLDGAVVGFTTFAGMGANNLCPYFVTDDTNWEVGIGTILTGPARLQRTTVLRSSNADAAVNWAAGTRKLRCGLPAAMAIPRMLTKSVAGAANVALTQDEQRRNVLVFTGALTGNIDVTVDASVWEWTVFNNTTGAFTLTFKVSGGTGKVVPQGLSTRLRSDATNIVNAIDYLSVLAVGGLLDLSGSGAGQIKFPATQNASSDQNTLDDYEKGTFTPGISFGGGTTGITYGVQVGAYTKIGNRVLTNSYFTLTGKGSSTGAVLLTGQPFTSNSTASSFGPQAVFANTLSSTSGGIIAFNDVNATTVQMYQTQTGTGAQLTHANFNNTSDVMLSTSYRV